MPGVFDIFRLASESVAKAPWRWKGLIGATGGAAVAAVYGDSETPIAERITKGLVIGGGLAAVAPAAIRGFGHVASGAERVGTYAFKNKMAALKTQGAKALWKPGTLALGGAALGAALAPQGYGLQGAAVGAGVGFAAIPATKLYKGFEALGKVPGGQTTALLAAAAVPVAAAAVFGQQTPESEAAAVQGIGGTVDYSPLSGSMADRMIAMNASGDIVLGLNGQRHG